MLRRNALIFHSGALGDFVLNWPLAMALGRIYAQSRIIYVTAGEKGKLAERVLRIDAIDVETGWHHLFAGNATPPENVLRFLDGAHAIFSFVGTAESVWAANVRRLAPHAKLICAEPNPPGGFAGHASEHLLNELGADPVVATAVGQMLRSIAARGTGLARNVGGPIVIHPGAGALNKCWPKERFISLAERLRADGREVQVVIGEAEVERWSEQETDAFGPVKQPATLIELFQILSKASAVVANDSGAGHLAGIIGLPTVCLFGPTDPAVWKPMGPAVRVIHRKAMEEIEVEEVIAAIDEKSRNPVRKSEIRNPKSESNPNDQ